MIYYTVIMVGQRNMQDRASRMYELVVGKQATGRYIGGGRGKPAPTVGCLPTTISYTHMASLLLPSLQSCDSFPRKCNLPRFYIYHRRHGNASIVKLTNKILAT